MVMGKQRSEGSAVGIFAAGYAKFEGPRVLTFAQVAILRRLAKKSFAKMPSVYVPSPTVIRNEV
jgi:hypothetical protein